MALDDWSVIYSTRGQSVVCDRSLLTKRKTTYDLWLYTLQEIKVRAAKIEIKISEGNCSMTRETFTIRTCIETIFSIAIQVLMEKVSLVVQ